MSNTSEITITINGEPVDFIRKDLVPDAIKAGELTMLVLHRGFIFVGYWDEESGVLSGASNVRKWSSGGFGGLTLGAKSSGAVLDKCADMAPPAGSLLNVLPLSEGWIDA